MARSGLSAIVLAAGEGTRMRSERPKPLHLLCGQPMLVHVLAALRDVDVDRTVVVVGHGAELVTKRIQEAGLRDLKISFVEQRVQQGTGDAVSVGLTGFSDVLLDDSEDVVILPGDTPLLRPATIAKLVDEHRASGAAATVLTTRLDDPTGYGRIVRDRNGNVAAIVEQRDANPDQLAIDEINTSIFCFRHLLLAPALRRLNPDNAAHEYYLTDVISVLHDAGYPIRSMVADDPNEVRGVNDRVQLAAAEAELRARINRGWMTNGVTMLDPAQTFIDTAVRIGRDVTLFPGTILQGSTTIGGGCEIGPGTRLVDCVVGPNAVIEQTTARNVTIGAEARVGPYVYLPPGTEVPPGAHRGPTYTDGDDST